MPRTDTKLYVALLFAAVISKDTVWGCVALGLMLLLMLADHWQFESWCKLCEAINALNKAEEKSKQEQE